MPTVVKFLVVLAVLAGVAGAGVFYLANFVAPKTRELTVKIPTDKLQPVAVVSPPQQEAGQTPLPGGPASDPGGDATTTVPAKE